MFYINQLPVPRLASDHTWYRAIVERAARLICTSEEFADLWDEVMHSKWSVSLAATTDEDRNQLRAELDGIIAHIYGISELEFEYILSTFPIVPIAQKQLAMEEYQKLISKF